MSNGTFLFFSVLQTVFIAIASLSSGYAAYNWHCVWREPETKHKSLSRAMFNRERLYFGMVFIWFVLRMIAWAIGAVSVSNSTIIGVFTGIVLGFMAMMVGLYAGGVANGWFSAGDEG